MQPFSDERRMSFIGLRGSNAEERGTSYANDQTQKILQLQEELEECKEVINEKENALENLLEEFTVFRTEYTNIVKDLVDEVKAKDNEINQLRAQQSKSQTTVTSDKVSEYKENLQHTRQQHKQLQKTYRCLQDEFEYIRDQAKEYYSRRMPSICPLTDNNISLSQFIQQPKKQIQKQPETMKKKQDPVDSSKKLQLIVELPNNLGTKNFSFAPNVTIDLVKKSVFKKTLPHLRANLYLFGISPTEYLESEFIKFLDAHESFYDLYALHQPIKVSLYCKTRSRMLGDLDLQFKHNVKNSKEEMDRLKRQMGKPRQASQPSIMRNPASAFAPRTGNSPGLRTRQDSSLLKLEPKPLSQSDSEEIEMADSQDPELPYEQLSEDHFPIAILTPNGVPFVVFIPYDSTGESLKEFLLEEMKETVKRLDGNQKIFFYHEGKPDEFILLDEPQKVREHPSVTCFRKIQKIPIASIGERIAFREPTTTRNLISGNQPQRGSPANQPQRDTSESMAIPGKESAGNSPRQYRRGTMLSSSVKTIPIEKSQGEKTNFLSRELSVSLLSPSVLASPRNFDTPNREAIPVTFCYEDQKILLNLPRKANIETIKKLVLQKLGLDDGNSSAVRYALKVTGTSNFISEGETLLENLSIVKFSSKKGLTTMLSLVTREKSKEDKLISKKIGLILSDGTGDDILNWGMKDTDATDFRIKMSRIIGDKQYRYVPAVFADSTPCKSSFSFPETIKICVHLGDEGGDGLQDCTTVLRVAPNQLAQDIIERSCKKFTYAANFAPQPGGEYFLKICGYEVYIRGSSRLDSIPYIRDCIQKKKLISLTLVPSEKTPLHEQLSKNVEPKRNAFLEETLFETATVDVFGDQETVSLLELKSFFEFKVQSIENLSAVGKKEGDSFFLEAGIYHGGILIDNKIMNSPTVTLHNGTIRWRQWMRSSLRMCEIPEDSRICLTLFIKKDSGIAPVANVNASLFDFKDHFRTGNVSLQMWMDEVANPIGTCMENLRAEAGKVPVITLSFHSFPMNVAFPNLKPLVVYDEPEEPTPAEKANIRVLIESDPLHRLEDSEKQFIWKYREWLRLNEKPKALIKILLCVKWTSIQQVRETYRLLSLWEPVAPVDALQLLDAQFANRKVREYAVHCLDKLSDEELKDYLLQLVQTLKFEPNHFSPLGAWLLNRALQNQILIGHAFFWHLKSEVHVPEIAERYALLLEMYLRGCGAQRDDLLKQVQVINSLNQVAQAIRQVPSSRRKADLQKRLSQLSLPPTFQLPLDPVRKASGLVIEKCKSMDSAKAPLWLVFKNADTFGDDIWLIFKSGDDLRQDSLTLQLLGIMDKIWQSEGLDLCLTPYKCIATGDEMGMIETVLESDTTANIQKAAGGVAGALKQTPLANWIKNHNPDGYDQAVENFTRSCAGYCVATYVLGIGDRHNDNIMVNKHGFLFHIDFGHFLGHYKKVLYVRRERAPFVLTPEFANVMGCKGSDNFNKFVNFCTQGYNILRKHSHVFINLLAMMLATGIPELKSENDIQYLRDALEMNLSDEEGSIHFTKLIEESLESMSTQLMFVTHIIAHPK